MTSLRLTDITIRLPPELQQQHDAFTDASSLFMDVEIDNEVRRIGPLVRKSASSWMVAEDVEIPASLPVIKITIVLQRDAQPCTEIGSVEIMRDTVLSRCTEQVDEITQTIIGVGNMPTLELSYNCSAIRSEESDDIAPNHIVEGSSEDPDHAFAALECEFNDALLLPDEYEQKPALLSWAAWQLGTIYMESEKEPHLNKAIQSLDVAMEFIPEGHSSQNRVLGLLGLLLSCRAERCATPADINRAISTLERYARVEGEAEMHYLVRIGLGTMHLLRFEHLGELTDLDMCISAYRDVVYVTPEGHADKPGCLNNLGNSFGRRFERTGEVADIEEAISAHEHAVHLTPEAHADKPGHLSNLAKCFQQRFDRFHQDADLDKALEHFQLSAVCLTGPPLLRYHSARQWARLASDKGSVTLVDAYSLAISLLPRLAWLGQTISQRHKALAFVGDIGNEAAAAAIRLGRFNTALEWLEASRSVVWSQLLHLRTPVDELHSLQPELADELVRISRDLDSAGTREFHSDSSNQQSSESMENAALRHYRLAERWDSLVAQARAVPGFEDFLRPKTLPHLVQAARSGPVITINVHKSRCDCLALLPGRDDVIHIPLEHFSYEQVLRLKSQLDQLLSPSPIRKPDIRGHDFVPRRGTGLTGILSALWYAVAKPVLDTLAFGVSNVEDSPRIWWCPTGPLSFLPIHAAGIYATTNSTLGFKVTDFVTSSYTPTLTTLIERSRTSRTTFEGLLTIGQLKTPGRSSLPNVAKELLDIQLLSSADFHIHSLQGAQATIQDVVKGMREHSWVHLACHATQDVSDPTQSAFHVHDGSLTLSRIISNSFPHADFAFLSACQTAKGDDKLPDEAVHLAGGMIAAGYRSVIATMWPIKDWYAPMIASEVYRRLDCGPSPDSRRAAHALQHAVKHREQFGDSEASLLRWVPFIHVGI